MKKLSLLLLLISCLCASPSYAAFSVSVAPYEGGFTLDFGKVCFTPDTASKEVTVRVDSNIGKQYRLLQTLMDPLVSPQGDSLTAGTFVVYSARGSNHTGTLLTDFEVPVTMNRTPVYVSDQQGNSDAFTLIYALKGPCNVPSGTYRGRLRFTLEAVDSSMQQVETYLDVIAQIENTASSISVATPGGMKLINVKLAKSGVENGTVIFTVKNPSRLSGRVTQVFANAPASSDGSELPLEMLTVKTGGAPAEKLSSERQVIFPSIPDKEGDTIVEYGLASDAIKAGLYRTKVHYVLEGGPKGNQEIGVFGFEASVEKIFDLQLSTETGGGTISFRDLKPNQPPRSFEVTVAVKSNAGKKYQVTQKVLSDLVNKEGQAIPGEDFTVMTEKEGATRGTLKLPVKTPMKIGDQVLFVSDSAGTPDSFKIVYGLSTPASVKAGDYAASVVYSLSEI